MTAIHDGDAPVRRGAVDDAVRKMRAAAAADGRDDAPGAAGTVDPAVLRTVLATLPHDDQRLLWDRHVVGRELAAIAADLGMHARAALRRLRQAEERLGAAFAAAHARACPPGCLDTRQELHSYLRHRLSPPRRTVLEAHLFGCQGCMRAFIDVREAGWAVRDAGPLLVPAAGVAAGAPVVVGALGAATTGGAAVAWAGPVGAVLLAAGEWVRAVALRLGQLGKAGLIGAGTVAGVAVAAVAVALSGGVGGPTAAAPPAPAPTSSAMAPAPAPGDADSPDAPPEPEPSATTSSAPVPSDDASTPPSTDGPTPDPMPTASTPTAAPTATQPGTPEPSDPDGEPTPSPEPSGSTEPTRPSSSPSPSSPSPTPTPTPSPTPSPSPVRTTVTAATSGLRGVYQVATTDPAAEVVKVTEDRRWLRAKVCRHDGEGWHVASWHNDVGELSVTVEAPAGVSPEVTVERVVNWPEWIWTC